MKWAAVAESVLRLMLSTSMAPIAPEGQTETIAATTINRSREPRAIVADYTETIRVDGPDSEIALQSMPRSRWAFVSDGRRYCFRMDRGIVAALWDGRRTWSYMEGEAAVSITTEPISPHPEGLAELLLACEGLDATRVPVTLASELEIARSARVVDEPGGIRRVRYELPGDQPGWSYEIAGQRGLAGHELQVHEQIIRIRSEGAPAAESRATAVRLKVVAWMEFDGMMVPAALERTTHEMGAGDELGPATSTIRYDIRTLRRFVPEDRALLEPPDVRVGWHVRRPSHRLEFEVGSRVFSVAGRRFEARDDLELDDLDRLDALLLHARPLGGEAPSRRAE